MKEFFKNLLILLSAPLYILAALLIYILWASMRVGEGLMDLMEEWIDFMKEDYKSAYEVIKNVSRKR